MFWNASFPRIDRDLLSIERRKTRYSAPQIHQLPVYVGSTLFRSCF
jgi:hypothetical protein